MKNDNNKFRGALQIVILVGFAAYNYIAVLSINSIKDKISYIDKKIELSNYNSSNIPDLLAVNKKYVDYLNGNTKTFEADVDYLESLEAIKEICKTNNVAANDLGSELKNTLEVDQGAFEGYNKTTERYEINLKVAGSYINIGKVLEQLSDKDYQISSIKLSRFSNSRVTGYLSLYQYISKPLIDSDVLTINFDSAVKNTPLYKDEGIDLASNWKKDIFYKNKKVSKPAPNNRAYYLTNVRFSANPSVTINGKTYQNGSVIDNFIVKDITTNSATLSSSRKSIVLQLEKEIVPQVSTDGFKEAFVKARRNGQNYFEYKGKLYSTDLN